jgi:hypothetical protein
MNYILPIIKKNNKKIILITTQWQIPQIEKSDLSLKCLNDENILFWISQNPIYENSNKYLGIPYGFHLDKINDYMKFLKENDNIDVMSKNNIENLPATVHSHLSDDHIRKKYSIFSNNTIRLHYKEYLQKILNSKFVISTEGDRKDTYRHYECIGLKAIPISNINYRSIFGENMIYSNAEDMVNMVKTGIVNEEYKVPNRDILLTQYWVDKINELIQIHKRNIYKISYSKSPIQS